MVPYKTDDEQPSRWTPYLGHKYGLVEVEGYIQPVHFFEGGEQSVSDTEMLKLMKYYR